MHPSRVAAAALLVSALFATNVAAVDPTSTLSLPNPGARSMALGGAFVAQADDATAAFANPAGLVQLLDPEISIEGRVWLYSSDPKEGFGGETGQVNDISGVGFLSGVLPVRQFSLAIYRNQLAKFDVDSSLDTWYGEYWDVSSLEIVTWGLAGAYRISESLSVGAGVAYHKGQLETFENGESDRSKSDGWGVNAGVLWKPTPSFNFGGFFRQGAELEVDDSVAGSHADGSRTGIPDVFGLGAAYRTPGGSFALLAEWDHVGHSALDGALVGDTRIELDDTDEFHVGAEYAFLWAEPVIAIRVGAWHDPAHRWLWEGTDRRRLDKDQLHGSAGLGVAWKHFQFDFALDVSDPVVTLSISGIFSF